LIQAQGGVAMRDVGGYLVKAARVQELRDALAGGLFAFGVLPGYRPGPSTLAQGLGAGVVPD